MARDPPGFRQDHMGAFPAVPPSGALFAVRLLGCWVAGPVFLESRTMYTGASLDAPHRDAATAASLPANPCFLLGC